MKFIGFLDAESVNFMAVYCMENVKIMGQYGAESVKNMGFYDAESVKFMAVYCMENVKIMGQYGTESVKNMGFYDAENVKFTIFADVSRRLEIWRSC